MLRPPTLELLLAGDETDPDVGSPIRVGDELGHRPGSARQRRRDCEHVRQHPRGSAAAVVGSPMVITEYVGRTRLAAHIQANGPTTARLAQIPSTTRARLDNRRRLSRSPITGGPTVRSPYRQTTDGFSTSTASVSGCPWDSAAAARPPGRP